MIRLSTLTLLAVLGSPFVAACASAPPPFGAPTQAYRGFKARTFVGTPDDVRPAVLATLRDMGFEVHSNGEEATYVSANRGMAAKDPAVAGDARTWMRVGVEIRFIDRHKRAPRTLVEVDAENVQGSSGGAIQASFGSVPGAFYEEFFSNVQARVPVTTQPRGLLPPA